MAVHPLPVPRSHPVLVSLLGGPSHLDLLGTRETSMATIVFITVWKNFGYFMVIFLAGLQGISAELYEAASLDGASAWQKFRYITLPALRPTFNYVVIFGSSAPSRSSIRSSS